jgi:hypothetical protein
MCTVSHLKLKRDVLLSVFWAGIVATDIISTSAASIGALAEIVNGADLLSIENRHIGFQRFKFLTPTAARFRCRPSRAVKRGWQR